MAYYTIPKFEGIIQGQRLIWETAGELVYLEPYGKDAIRTRRPCAGPGNIGLLPATSLK